MCEMNRETLDCLKRQRDICVKNVIPSQNMAFMFTLTLTNLGGLTRQSNEKADKQIKMVDLQFVDFPLW